MAGRMIPADDIERARAVPLEREIARRGIKPKEAPAETSKPKVGSGPVFDDDIGFAPGVIEELADPPPAEEIPEAEAFAPTWSRKDDPWSSPSWKKAAADYHADRKRGAAEPQCAEADRRAARRQHDLPANWETMSVGGLWHALNDPRRYPIPKSIVDTFQYLIKQGDRERLKAWLAGRSPEERRALRNLREKSL
jgi:hypothetical protein